MVLHISSPSEIGCHCFISLYYYFILSLCLNFPIASNYSYYEGHWMKHVARTVVSRITLFFSVQHNVKVGISAPLGWEKWDQIWGQITVGIRFRAASSRTVFMISDLLKCRFLSAFLIEITLQIVRSKTAKILIEIDIWGGVYFNFYSTCIHNAPRG